MGVRSGEQASKRRDILRRCFRQHTMTQVEDERTAAERPAQLLDRSFEGGAVRDQQHRIEIALDRTKPLKMRPGVAGRHHCIETDTIDAGLRNVPFVEQTRATGKTNDRMVGEPVL